MWRKLKKKDQEDKYTMGVEDKYTIGMVVICRWLLKIISLASTRISTETN